METIVVNSYLHVVQGNTKVETADRLDRHRLLYRVYENRVEVSYHSLDKVHTPYKSYIV